jgi:hypothetical protein
MEPMTERENWEKHIEARYPNDTLLRYDTIL